MTQLTNTRLILYTTFISLAFLLISCGQGPEEPEDQFSKHIRTTEARTPQEELAGFKLPPGFKIELFASEPDIGKPMNMSFDAKGRMWVTQSNEYPFYDTTGTGSDRISILEDTNHDGRADKIIVYADSLNIPIGITPVPNGALAFSIPYVYFLEDTDGDDRVDKRNVYLRGFEYKDTHGMINNFYRGIDGWIHADHGFSNVSKVVGTDNKEPLVMSSGNTFRFRLDGSGVEFTTTGRVNPFGYAMDELGYMYSVDCHSSPIYQLIRGADYPHFGKQPTGIGFGPYMMRHEYGSTALAGLEYYTGEQLPEDYQQNFFLGDVVKCRVYRSSIKMNGTTPIPTWEPDFVVSEDPWFRPVDIKQGPDGAIYIADFYNSIIGHYEVPLDHPARDRERGRIWRITYEGDDARFIPTDWTKENLKGLLNGLNESSQTVRMMVADQIVDRFGTDALADVTAMLNGPSVTGNQMVHGMWILFRLGGLNEDWLQRGLNSPVERIRVHTLRIMFEMDNLPNSQLDLVRGMLRDNSAHVKRAVTMLLAKYPSKEQLRTFLDLKANTPEDDTHFYYAIRQSLRDHLRDDGVMTFVNNNQWNETDAKALADVARGVDNQSAARFLLTYVEGNQVDMETVIVYATHISRYIPESRMDQLAGILKTKAGNDLDLQYKAFKSLQDGISQRGSVVQGEGRQWAIELAEDFLKEVPGEDAWNVIPTGTFYRSNPWVYEPFEANDQFPAVSAMISGPRWGQGQANNKLQSPLFILPETLKFHLVGRKNPPGEDGRTMPVTNWVECFLEGSDEPIRKVEITALDHRQDVVWDLQEFAGKMGYLVITDGSSNWNEYIGIGHLPSALIQLPTKSLKQQSERQIFACEVIKAYRVTSLTSQAKELLMSPTADVLARQRASEALLAVSPQHLELVGSVIANTSTPEFLKSGLLATVVDQRTPGAYQIVSSNLDTLSFDTQKRMVLALANDRIGIDEILKAADKLDISPKLLLEPRISELMHTHMTTTQKGAFEKLTKDLKPFSEEIQGLIDKRINEFATFNPSIVSGEKVFQQQCGICHQIKDQGGNIGPQLDGIGNWGLRALSEKILDPNRNISKAFINYTIEMKDGKVRQGLFRRDEGKVRVFANVAGQEFTIPISEIKSQTAVPFTLMPDHFSQVIPEDDYYHMMGYLLNQK